MAAYLGINRGHLSDLEAGKREIGLLMLQQVTARQLAQEPATRAPLGQVSGVSFLPTLAVPTACRICSSVESTVIGLTAAAGCWRVDCAGWALGEPQPVSDPISTSGTAHECRLREDSMLVSD